MSNPQMTCFAAVRPFQGFEGIYQGQPGTVPVAFPGTLDPLAGTPKYARNLLAGIDVPLGARLLIQIPIVIDLYTCESIYTYQLMWRSRNQQRFVQGMLSGGKIPPSAGFHINGDVVGRREFGADPSTDLYFIPGGSDVELFEQNAPVGNGAAIVVARQQNYSLVMEESWAQPLLPGGAGPAIWQQGVYQYSSAQSNGGPTFFPLWVDSCGDELTILAYKNESSDPWDFNEGGTDHGFSNTFGSNANGLPNNPNIGILISMGTMGGG